MKKILIALLFLTPALAFAQVGQFIPFLRTTYATSTQATTTNFAISSIASGNCLQTSIGGAIVSAGAACGSGSGGGISWPFTLQGDGTQSTTTRIGLYNGFLSLASSSVLGLFQANNATTTLLSAQYASTTILCISSDCRTAWPTAGSFSWPWTKQGDGYQATSTGRLFTGGLITTSSSTIGNIAVFTPANGSGIGTSTPDARVAQVQLASSTQSQLSLIYGAGTSNINFNNWGSMFAISTTSITNYATSSANLLSFDINGALTLPKIGTGFLKSTSGLITADNTTYTASTRNLTINGTTNQITSSAGAQDLSADRTWTLSLPNNLNLGTASTTVFGTGNAYFGTTGTSSFSGTGALFVNASTTLQGVFATNSTTTNATTSKMAFYNNDTSNMWVMKNFGSYLAFATTSNVNAVNSGATSSVDAVDFQSSGVGMGVGTTTLNNSYMVVANQASSGFGNIFTVANGTSTPFYVTSNGALYAPNSTGSGSSQTGYWCYDAGGQLIRDTAVCIVSALRFKKDITPIDVGLSDLMKLRPVNYYYKDASFGANKMMGFIADEVASSSPKLNEELVTYDKTGLIHGFNYETFTALLAKSIQDFYGQFQTLIARVSGLENKVNAQQKEIDALNARLNKLEK